MWRLTWAQMRRNVGKLIAVGIAIALGTGFITATFVTTNAVEDTALAAARSSLGDPDLVVSSSSYSLEDASVEAAAATPGVEAVYAWTNTYREITTGQGSETLQLNPPAPVERLSNTSLREGRLPGASGEIALPGATAERLGAQIGSTVDLVNITWSDGGGTSPDGSDTVDASDGELVPTRTVVPVTVVGLLADGTGFGFGMPAAVADTGDLTDWRAAAGDTAYGQLTLTAEPGTDLVALADAVAVATQDAVADPDDSSVVVMTGEQYSRDIAKQLTGGIEIFRALILAFAAVAMAVAGIVIANTFTVLVAQRTRTLALLRCVGATRSQVKRSVRLEALVLGVVASLAGILVGLGIGQLALTIIARQVEGVPAPTTVPVDVATIVVPLLAGVIVTVVAASGAARLATSVAPLAALRPVDTVVSSRSRRLRPVIGWVLTIGGLAMMVGGLVLSRGDGMFEVALGIGVLGGIVSIVGVVMAAITIVPALARVLGRGVASVGGAPTTLAATNAVRNPRRITSTATALLVGVALVTMMSTGAAMARTQLTNELDAQYALDIAVSGEQIPAAMVDAVAAVDGVEHSVLMDVGQSEITTDLTTSTVTVVTADPATLPSVLGTAPEDWDPQTVLVDGYLLNDTGTVTLPDGREVAGQMVRGLPDYTMIVTQQIAQGLDLEYPQQSLWVALADSADPIAVSGDIRDAVSATTVASDGASAPTVDGGAIQKAGFTQVLDTLLAVVVGLLGVAVVIALIGVANTLSLSVVERRRENALLRALGLTRRQLRTTLAVEGVLLAVVGAIVGLVLGLLYGWVGGLLMLGPTTGMTIGSIVVPWSSVLVVLVVAVAAGVLASVLPARGAVKVPPVAALAAE